MTPKIEGPQKINDPQKCWTQILFGTPQNFQPPEISGPQNLMTITIQLPPKLNDPQIWLTLKFLDPKYLDPLEQPFYLKRPNIKIVTCTRTHTSLGLSYPDWLSFLILDICHFLLSQSINPIPVGGLILLDFSKICTRTILSQ